MEYRKKINKLVRKAAFTEYIKEKEQKSKLNNLTYATFNTQPYLTKCGFTNKEMSLLYSLRSRSHPAQLPNATTKKYIKTDFNAVLDV